MTEPGGPCGVRLANKLHKICGRFLCKKEVSKGTPFDIKKISAKRKKPHPKICAAFLVLPLQRSDFCDIVDVSDRCQKVYFLTVSEFLGRRFLWYGKTVETVCIGGIGGVPAAGNTGNRRNGGGGEMSVYSDL